MLQTRARTYRSRRNCERFVITPALVKKHPAPALYSFCDSFTVTTHLRLARSFSAHASPLTCRSNVHVPKLAPIWKNLKRLASSIMRFLKSCHLVLRELRIGFRMNYAK